MPIEVKQTSKDPVLQKEWRLAHRPSRTLDPINAQLFFIIARSSRSTIRGLSKQIGLAPTTVHRRLWQMWEEGLITWDDGLQGTIRPAVGLMAANPQEYPSQPKRQKKARRRA